MLVVFLKAGPSNVHVWVLWLSCETPAARGVLWCVVVCGGVLWCVVVVVETISKSPCLCEGVGLHTTTRELQTRTFERPGASPHPSGPHHPHRHQKKKKAKCGKIGQIRLAKCGQLSLAKCSIGQIRFGQMRPNKDGQIRFGQMRSRPCQGGGSSNGGGRKGGGPTQEKVGARMVGARTLGARTVEARRVGAQNFALFFPSPATIVFLFSLSCWSFRGILVVFEAPGTLKCARLEFSGCRVKPRRPRSRLGG